MADDIRRLSDELARDPGEPASSCRSARRCAGRASSTSRSRSRCAASSGIRTTPTRTTCSRASPSTAASCSARSTSGTWCCASRRGHVGALQGHGLRLLPAGTTRRRRSSISRRRRRRTRATRRSRRRWRTCVRRASRRARTVAGERRAMRRTTRRLPRRTARVPHARPALPVRRHAGRRASRPRCCSTRRARARPAPTSTHDGERRGAGGRRGAERRDRRSAARDAAPRPRRLDVDRLRDGGRGRRDGAVAATTGCSCWRRRARRRSGSCAALLDRCARARAPLARRSAPHEHALHRRCSTSLTRQRGVRGRARRRASRTASSSTRTCRSGRRATAWRRSRRRCIARRGCRRGAARLGAVSFLQLEAPSGPDLCAVGARRPRARRRRRAAANIGLIRVELLERAGVLARGSDA